MLWLSWTFFSFSRNFFVPLTCTLFNFLEWSLHRNINNFQKKKKIEIVNNILWARKPLFLKNFECQICKIIRNFWHENSLWTLSYFASYWEITFEEDIKGGMKSLICGDSLVIYLAVTRHPTVDSKTIFDINDCLEKCMRKSKPERHEVWTLDRLIWLYLASPHVIYERLNVI